MEKVTPDLDVFSYLPLEVGVEQDFSTYQFLRAFPIGITPILEKPIKLVKIKRDRYKVFQMPMGISIKDIEVFCYKNSRQYGKQLFHSSFVEEDQYTKLGISLYNGRHRSFITTGFMDKHCDIIFPKIGSRSDLLRYPLFAPLDIVLPTDPTIVEEKLMEKSLEMKEDTTLIDTYRTKILTKLTYASFLYQSRYIWKSGAIPENYLHPYLKTIHREGMEPVTKKMSERDLQHFERARIDIILGKVRTPIIECLAFTGEKLHEPISSDTFLVNAKTEKKDQDAFRQKYPALTPETLKMLFKFMRDAITNDQTTKEFFSTIMPLIYSDKVKISITSDPKQMLKIEYQPN